MYAHYMRACTHSTLLLPSRVCGFTGDNHGEAVVVCVWECVCQSVCQ